MAFALAITVLLGMALAGNAWALDPPGTSDEDLRARLHPSTSVVPEWLQVPVDQRSRQDFLNEWLSQAQSRRANDWIDKGWTWDHIQYGEYPATYTTAAHDTTNVAYVDQWGAIRFNNELYGFVAGGVPLRVLKVGDGFIMAVCGNHTAASPPAPTMPTISGYKFEDRNANTRWDAGEPPLAGLTVTLRREGAFVSQTTTGSDGKYVFSFNAIRQANTSVNLDPGTYTVTESCPSPWRNTVSPAPVVIPAGPGIDHANNNFGNYYPGVIKGAKWDDSNVDGVWQKDVEAPLSGWTTTPTDTRPSPIPAGRSGTRRSPT